jgi:hypothetical protein
VVFAFGVCLAVLEWSAAATLVMLLIACCFSVAGRLVVWSATDRLPADGRVSWRRLAPRSLATGAGLVTLFVLAESSPPLALLGVLLFVSTCPALLRRVRGDRLPRPGRPTHPVPTRVSGPVRPRPGVRVAFTELDDEALCRLWRRTYWQLQLDATATELLDLVALRQACLDELERRNPTALRAWLSSGARASGGPERFWSRREHPGSADAA